MALNTSAHLANAREFYKQNRLDEAETELLAIFKHDQNNAAARTLLAATFLKAGRIGDAQRVLEQVLELEPTRLEAISLFGIVRMAQKDFRGAIEQYQRLLELVQPTADIYNQIGTCWLELGDEIQAGGAFKRAIELDPRLPHSYYNLGMALRMAGNSYETFITFKRSTELNPGFHENYVQLWQQMRQLLNWNEGLPLLEMGLRRFPDSTLMRIMLASTYGKLGEKEKAEAIYKTAAAIDPAAGPPYAHWLQEEGRFEDSIPVLKDALRLDPVQGQAYYNLAMAKCFEIDGRSVTDIIPPLLDHEAIREEGRMYLYYTLAKAYEQEKNYELTMRNYDFANEHAYRLYNAEIVHNPAAVESERQILAELFSLDKMERLRQLGSEDATPIFIVGMIRTGTTLLDQILSSHPRVKSAGEQPFWQVSAGRVNRRWTESGGDVADIRELEANYLSVLRTATGGAFRITDKMPTNFNHMGLISIVFPKAKFIHIRRSPMDTCLSIYTTFLGKGTQFAYNQTNIVGYYRAYMKMMDYWRTVISADQMIEIDYEELVSNKEPVLREVLSFCGLDWDDAVLTHEEHASHVSTPSLWTARQPVNTASVERWRKYEPWLGQLLELRDLKHPPASYVH